LVISAATGEETGTVRVKMAPYNAARELGSLRIEATHNFGDIMPV